MCEPVTILTALSIATAAVGSYGQYQQASAQQHALDSQAQVAADENRESTQTAMGERVKQARMERARIRVAAGESGVGGNSYEAQLGDSFARQNMDLATLQTQSRWNQRSNEARTASAFASIDKPNAFSAGLQIAGAGYSGYTQGQELARLRIPTTP